MTIRILRLLPLAACVMAFSAADAVAQTGQVIYACVHQGSLFPRIIGATDTCRNNEQLITWNVQGPAGLQGPAGEQGPEGPEGPTGPQGAQGAQGDPGTAGQFGATVNRRGPDIPISSTAFTTVYTTTRTSTALATWLVSYNFAVQISPATSPCVIFARLALDGVAPYDHTLTSLTPLSTLGTTGGATNLLAFPNVAPGSHDLSLQLLASELCVNPTVMTTGYFAGTWGSTLTVAFLNQ